MTNQKLIEVFTFYRQELTEQGVEPKQLDQYDNNSWSYMDDQVLGHLAWMCIEAIAMVRDGRKEKAFRWLGFIQGVLFSEGFFTLDDLKNHSRPT